MRSPVTRQSDRAKSHKTIKSNSDNAETPLDIQAEKLRRLYFFCHATAVTIAALDYAGGPR
jgi:hypothetical protein